MPKKSSYVQNTAEIFNQLEIFGLRGVERLLLLKHHLIVVAMSSLVSFLHYTQMAVWSALMDVVTRITINIKNGAHTDCPQQHIKTPTP
jgi:hypothetical protein